MSQAVHPPVGTLEDLYHAREVYRVLVLVGVFSGGWVLQAHTGEQEILTFGRGRSNMLTHAMWGRPTGQGCCPPIPPASKQASKRRRGGERLT